MYFRYQLIDEMIDEMSDVWYNIKNKSNAALVFTAAFQATGNGTAAADLGSLTGTGSGTLDGGVTLAAGVEDEPETAAYSTFELTASGVPTATGKVGELKITFSAN